MSFWAIFLPFYHSPNDPEYQNFEKNKTGLEILSFYTYMCTINEEHMIHGSWNIRCDRLKFSTFWAIFCPLSPLTTWKIKILTLKKTPGDITILQICTINNNHMMYSSWYMELDRHNFLSFWTVFLHFYPPMDPENQNFQKKWKKHLKVLSLYKYKWQSWCMVPQIWSATDRIFCHFGLFFALLPTYQPEKSKFWKNQKIDWRYYHFTHV